MTVSIRIAGKLVHVSNKASRAPGVDAGSASLLRRARLDPSGCHELRHMLVAEVGTIVQRMADPLVIEEACKRISSGRWSLSVVDVPQMGAAGTQGGANPGPRKEPGNDALKGSKKRFLAVWCG